jgi:hypothetical protein
MNHEMLNSVIGGKRWLFDCLLQSNQWQMINQMVYTLPIENKTTGHRGCLHYSRQMHYTLSQCFDDYSSTVRPPDDDFLQFFTPSAFKGEWKFTSSAAPISIFQGGLSLSLAHMNVSLYILYWRMHLQWGMLPPCGCSLWNQYGCVYVCLMQCGVGKSIEGERQPAAAAVCMSTPRSLPMPAAYERRKGKILMISRRGAVCFWDARLQLKQKQLKQTQRIFIQCGGKFHLISLVTNHQIFLQIIFSYPALPKFSY